MEEMFRSAVVGFGLKVDGKNQFATHFPADIDGEIVEQAAIHENVLLVDDWAEETRQRHGGAHRLRDWPITEDVLLLGDEIDCDAAKRNGELVEVLNIGIRQHVAVENQ